MKDCQICSYNSNHFIISYTDKYEQAAVRITIVSRDSDGMNLVIKENQFNARALTNRGPLELSIQPTF